MNSITFDLAGKTRDKPVSDDYVAMLNTVVQRTDPSLSVRVTSGGQDPAGSGGKRTGSNRHDVDHTGHAHTADMVLQRDGKDVLPGQDKALYASFFKNAAAEGFTGLGHYEWGVHIGGGSEAAWGPSTSSRDLDPVFASAIAEGRSMRKPRGAIERAPLPPLGEAPAAAPSRGPRPSWWNTVEQTSATLGVDADTLYRIGGAESMFHNVPNASGPGGKPTSSAHGPFQIIEGTWAGLAKNYPHLGLTNRLDPEQQAKAAPYLLREYRDDVKRRIGRDLTQGEQYLAWFLGPRDAAKVLNAPTGAAARGIVTPASVAANPDVFRKAESVDQLRAWAEEKMRGEGVDGSPAPDAVAPVYTEQFKDTRLSVLDLEPTSPFSALERRKAERALAGDAYGLGEGLYRAIGQEATGQIGAWMTEANPVSDPNFRVTPEILKAKAADIPDQFLDYLGGSLSEADMNSRLRRLRSDLDVQQKLAAMGGTGTMLQLGAALVDPAGWVASLAAAPIGGMAKASRASKILFGAAEGFAGNVALEAAVSQFDPTWEANRMIYAGAGGILFGGGLGAFRGGSKVAELPESTALRTAAEDTMAAIERDFSSSSAGAAQNAAVRAPVRADVSEFLERQFGEQYGKGALSKARFDLTARLKASENPLVRALGHVFTEETVGNADGTATMRAISEDQVKLQKQNETLWYRDLNENWRDYAKRNGLNAFKDAHTGAMGDFKRQVTLAARNTDPTAEFDPAVARQAASFKNIMGRYLRLAQGDRMEFDGTVRAGLPGFKDLTGSSDAYVPRLIHWGNFNALVKDFGTEGVTQLVTRAMRGMNPDLSEEAVTKLGKGYVKRLSSVEAGQETGASRIFSTDNLDELRANLEGLDLLPEDIDAVMRPMVRKEGNGAGTPRGKRRELLNENFAMRLRSASGTERDVRIDELFEGDIDKLFSSYNRNMSGQIALAGLRVRNPKYRAGSTVKRSVTKQVAREVEEVVPGKSLDDLPDDVAEHLDAFHQMQSGKLPYGMTPLENRKPIFKLVDDLSTWMTLAKHSDAISKSLMDGKWRDAEVSFDKLQTSQHWVERAKVESLKEAPAADAPTVVKLGDQYIIRDGNHRLTALKESGAKTAKVRVVELGDVPIEKFEDPTLPAKSVKTVYDDVSEEVDEVVGAEGDEWLIDGIHNGNEWDKLLKQVREVASSSETSDAAREAVEADVTRLQFVYDAVAGRPSKFDTTNTARAARLLRDYIFTRVMGQVGFAQVAEIGMITSSVGLKAAIKSMPSFRQFLKDARTGRLSDEDARQLEWISTGGTDWIRGISHMTTDEFGAPLSHGGKPGMMDKAEAVLSRATRAQSAMSGMSSINTYLQRWASKAALYKFLDMSDEGARVNRRRMRVLGLSDDMQERIFKNIRRHKADVPGEEAGSTIGRLNLEKWEPEVRAAFEHSIFRWTRKMIQENDIGQTNTILGHSAGKLLFQFRGFMFGAWTKNTLHNIHMRDWESLSGVISTMTFGAIAYAAQVHLQSLGRADREEFLADRLSMKKLSGAAFQRAGWSSMFPAGIDQAGFLLGADPLFDTRVTSTPSQDILSFPAASLYDDATKAVRGLSGAALGGGYSRQDARAAWSLLPFQNTLPMLWLYNGTLGQLPTEGG